MDKEEVLLLTIVIYLLINLVWLHIQSLVADYRRYKVGTGI